MPQRIHSYQIADSIDIKQFKSAFKGDLYYGDSDELFYRTQDNEFIYVFKYGAVSFLNFDAIKISEFLRLISTFCKNFFKESLTEDFEVEINAEAENISYHAISIIGSNVEKIRLIMLNVTQSVALDYYYELTTTLLEETNLHTQMLETKGRLSISGVSLKKYIGRTLLLKNRIAENLYIFDSPPATWEDEDLDRINMELKRTFDIQERFRNIHEGLTIVKDNLDLFRDLLQYRHSTFLEWIVIGLILIEVINLFIEKLL